MKRGITPIIFALLVALTLIIAGCDSAPLKFSPVLNEAFDPVAAFRKQGYTVQGEARGEGIRNEVHGYGWQSWCGILSGTEKPVTLDGAAVVIRDELKRILNGSPLDGLPISQSRSADQPLTGMLRYNKDDAHGDMHVWLMPDSSGTNVSYVIFVREQRLK
jgi:hypothetical protein